MTTPIEDYALIGDTQTAALVGRRRLHRLAVRAPLRLRRVLRRAPRRRDRTGTGSIAPAAGRPGDPPAHTATAPSCSRPSSTRPRAPSGSSTACRCATSSVDVVRVVEGRQRARADAHGPRRALRLRRASCRGCGRSDGTLRIIAGPDALCLTTPVRVTGHDYRHTAEFTVAAGDRVPFVLAGYPSYEDRAAARRRLRRARAHHRASGRSGSARSTYDGDVARRRAALADHAEGADLRPDRRDRRRADHVAARADRRRAQLGLPLLLAARRDVHALLAHDRGVHRGGVRVARLAAARGGRRPRAPADHVRRRRASGGSASTRSTGSRATRGRRRCGSATPPTDQFQLDVYGEVLDALHQSRRMRHRGRPRTRGRCERASSSSSRPAGREPDEGIWEVRGARQHFTHSKVMAWVAFDRAVEGRRGVRARRPGRPLAHVLRRDPPARCCERGFDAERNAFVQSYGSQRLDASLAA